MRSKNELETYRDELISENNIDLINIKLLEPTVALNKRRTTDLVAKSTRSIKNPNWTDQWMALSEQYSGVCQCASCGKLIFADTSDPKCIELATAYRLSGIEPDCTPETLLIQGAHIILTQDIFHGQNRIASKGETFITPLCRECNNPSKEILNINIGTIITPEIR